MDNFELNSKPSYQEEDSLDIKGIIIKVISYWYLFVIGVVIALAIGFIYNRYTPKVYQVSSTLFIKEDKMTIDPTSMMTGLTFKSHNNIANEIGILQSFSMKERTLNELEFFNVSYFNTGRVSTTELYTSTPFNVELDYDTVQTVGIKYMINFIDQNQYSLKTMEQGCAVYDYTTNTNVGYINVAETNNVYRLGEWVDNGYNRFRVVLNNNYDYEAYKNSKLSFVINSKLALAGQMSGLSISQITKESSIIVLTLQGHEPQKITDYLNKLLEEYLERNLEQKNLVSENTVLFIDEQLVGIQDSLAKAESDLQSFQEGNDFMDLTVQSQSMFANLKSIESRKAELEMSIKYYQNLQDYIKRNIDDINKLVVPSAMGIQDPMLNKLVIELVELSSEKSKILVVLQTQSNIHCKRRV